MASRRLKITLIAGIALVVTFAAVVLTAHFLVSRQDFELVRERLAARFEAATGLALEIRGSLELPYSLRPTLVFRDLVISNPNVETGRRLLSAAELRVTIDILPLLGGEVIVHESSLSAVYLSLEVDEGGNANWISPPSARRRAPPEQIAVHQFDLRDISLSYRNQQTGIEFSTHADRLSLVAPGGNEPIALALSTAHHGRPISLQGSLGSTEDLLAGNAFPIDLTVHVENVDIELTGRLDRIEDGALSGLRLGLRANGDDLRDLGELLGVQVPQTHTFSLAATLSTVDSALSASDVAADMAWRDSQLVVRGSVGDVRAWGGLELIARVSGDDLSDISELYEAVTVPQTDAYVLSGEIRGDWPSVTIHGAEASIRQAGNTLVASGRIDNLAAKEGIEVALEVGGDDLARLSALIELTLPPTDEFQLSGQFRGSWPALSVTQARASLERDALTMTMAGSIDDIVELTGIDLEVAARGTDLASVPELAPLEPPETDRFELEGRLRGSASQVAATGLVAVAELGEHRVTLSGDVEDVAELGGMNLRFSASGTDLSQLDSVLALKFPPTDSYRASATLSGDARTLTARDVVGEGTAPGIRLDVSGVVGRIFDLEDLDLLTTAVIDDLSRLDPYLDMSLPASEPIELSGRLTGTAPDLNVEDFTVRSGESVVQGSVALRTGERIGIVGSVSSGVLDLRPYFMAARERADVSAPSEDDRLFSDEPFDFSYLDALDAQFTLDNLELTTPAGNLHVNQATVTLELGALTIAPMELTRDDATISGHFRLDRQQEPEFDSDLSFENVDLARFMQDIRLREIYDGTFDVALDLQSRGTSLRQVMANLDGEFAAFVSEARVSEVSPTLRTPSLILELLPWLKRREDLVVNCAISQFDVVDGLVDVRLLYLDSAQMRMVGGGSIDLRAEQLNLRLSPRPRQRGILAHSIDITVTGPLIEPKVSSVGAVRALATNYGKYALLGPLGLLIPTEELQKHPCVGSLQEFRQQQAVED